MALTEIPIELSSTPGIVDNSNATAITIDSSENVGIGTGSPSTSLDVVRAGVQPLRLQSTSGTEVAINMVNTGGNVQLEAHSGNFNIDADAVGIGTSSPAVKLHVADGADSNAQIRINGSTSTVYSRLYSDNNGVLAIGTDGGNQAANSYMMFEVKGTERMRINASGNVGIGVVPATTQTLTAQITNGLSLFGNNTTPYGFISNNHVWATGTGDKYLVSNYGASYYKQYSGVHTWATAPSGTAGNPITFTPAMTLNASGNLLVGKTADDATTDGIQARGIGAISIARSSVAGDALLILNKKTNDGTIAEFRKDGTAVGSITSRTGATLGLILNVTSGVGAGFSGTSNAIFPIDETTTPVNDQISLGTEGFAFKDLRLSGGVYLGGTGAANKLEDYEEGTWTPTFGGTTADGSMTYSVQVGYYTKIGNLVTVNCRLMSATVTTSPTGNMVIRGLPFTVDSGTNNYHGASIAYSNSWATAPNGAHTEPNQTFLYLKVEDVNGNLNNNITSIAASDDIILSVTYRAA